MGEELVLVESFLRTMSDFIENGITETLVEEEVVNYFRICKQIEIYFEKFRVKGFFIVLDAENNGFSLSQKNERSKYDFSKIADKLFVKFCHPSSPAVLLKKAVDVFIKDFGSARVKRCVEEIAGMKVGFCLEKRIEEAENSKFHLEASLLMEGYECIFNRPRGIHRVRDMLNELIIEDECADTVVAMFAVENDLDPQAYRAIKKILLENLKNKFETTPHSRLWLRMICSVAVIDSINAHDPLMKFILDLVIHLSKEIQIKHSPHVTFYSPPGCLSYETLIHVINKLYKNKKTSQEIINLIFNQWKPNRTLWCSVLESCHAVSASEESPAIQYYDYTVRPVDWEPQ